MTHDVFISYSNRNKQTADAICHVLEQHKIKCWIAPRNITIGQKYGEVIEEAIRSCKVFIIVFSKESSLSPWVESELNVAFTDRRVIMPFRIDDTNLGGEMRLILNNKHWIDAYPDPEAKFDELLQAVARQVGIEIIPSSTEPKVDGGSVIKKEEPKIIEEPKEPVKITENYPETKIKQSKEKNEFTRKQYKKRIFIGIDLFVVATVLFLMPKWSWGIFPLYLYLVYFRANLSLMMLRNERKAIFGALIIMIFGLYMVADTNSMFGDIEWHYYGISRALLIYTRHERIAQILWLIIFCWFSFIPLFNCFGSKQKTNLAKWYDLFALTYFKRTEWSKTIAYLFIFSIVAIFTQIVGLRGTTILNSLIGIPLSLLGGWLLIRALGISWVNLKGKAIYTGAAILLLTAIWGSQYIYGEKRIIIFCSYALGLLLSFAIIWQISTKDKALKIWHSAILFLITFLVFPILSFGYNIFSCMDYALSEVSSSRGVYFFKDRQGSIGLRDRWGVIFPIEYEEKDDNILEHYGIIPFDPENAKAHIYMGYEYSKKGNYDKAIECYQKAISIDPQDKVAYNNMGVAYANKKNYDQAIECYQKAISINPEDACIYYNIGNICKENCDYDKAIECYQNAISIDPKYVSSYHHIGDVYGRKNDNEKRVEFYKKAAQLGYYKSQEWLTNNGYTW